MIAPMLKNRIISSDNESLQYVEKQTPELCLEAVKKDGRALQFVK